MTHSALLSVFLSRFVFVALAVCLGVIVTLMVVFMIPSILTSPAEMKLRTMTEAVYNERWLKTVIPVTPEDPLPLILGPVLFSTFPSLRVAS